MFVIFLTENFKFLSRFTYSNGSIERAGKIWWFGDSQDVKSPGMNGGYNRDRGQIKAYKKNKRVSRNKQGKYNGDDGKLKAYREYTSALTQWRSWATKGI